MPFTPQTARIYGQRGGQATVQRHGREHMRRIGQAGFAATVKRHYGGDARAAVNALIARGLMTLDPAPYNGAWQPKGDKVSDHLPPDWQPPQT